MPVDGICLFKYWVHAGVTLTIDNCLLPVTPVAESSSAKWEGKMMIRLAQALLILDIVEF